MHKIYQDALRKTASIHVLAVTRLLTLVFGLIEVINLHFTEKELENGKSKKTF
jgi:hypothetical protein